jgi:hypothetical protein
MHTVVAIDRLGKHVSAEKNSRNNRRVVFSVQSVSRSYKKDRNNPLSQLSFETPACQDINLGAEELRHQNY